MKDHQPQTGDGERCLICRRAVVRIMRQGKGYLRHRSPKGPEIAYGRKTRDPSLPPYGRARGWGS